MTDDKLQNIITELEKRNDKSKAYFGFYQYGGGEDESCIKANRQGLELYAVELLKAGIEIENRTFENGLTEVYGIEDDWADENADFFFDYIEFTKKLKEPNELFPVHKETWKDQLMKVLIMTIIFLLVAFLIIGFITALGWFF